ncbi:MAG: aldo/keto reductase [Henriciella sp.]|nr:aldo/keto reductase [Henriciella sp.]
MKMISLGQSGLKIGRIAYGCWRLDGDAVETASRNVEAALEHGLNLIDTADIYGYGTEAGFGSAEAVLGQVLQDGPGLRDQMVLATKGGIIPPRPYDSSYDYLIGAMDASLKRLRVDHVDLYQIHRPDLTAPFEDTARALNDIVRQGKVRYIGVSNFTPSQTRALQAHLDAPLVSTQPEFSALRQDPITDGTLDWCSETGAACLAWSPLAGGGLATGTGAHKRLPVVLGVIDRLAETHSATRTQIALAFTLKHQANIVPIIGTQKPDRIKDAAGAVQIDLSARDFYDIIEAYRGEPMP